MRMRNGTRTRVGSGSQRATRTKFRIRSVPPRSRTGEREWKTGNLRSRSSERQTPHRRQTATAVLTMMRYPNGLCALVFSTYFLSWLKVSKQLILKALTGRYLIIVKAINVYSLYSNSSQTRLHRPKTLMSFWSSSTKECLCGLAFWFMHSPLRYGPKCKETVGIGSLKLRNPKSMPFDRFFGKTN